MNYKVYYAQNREDIILSAFFDEDEKGFYVDVGASDPTVDSVTKYFYEKGWNGINIEPIEHLYRSLQKERPRDINLNIGIADRAGKRKFREYERGSGLSTFTDDLKSFYEAHGTDSTLAFRDYEVQVSPLKDVFTKQGVSVISFMKVDVEGLEYEALMGNDWGVYRPRVLCIEANHVSDKKDWRALLIENGYEKVFFDGLNEYYTDKKQPDIRKKFSYVDTVLGIHLLPSWADEEMQLLRSDLLNTNALVTRERIEADRLSQEVVQLKFQLHDARRVRNLLKMLVRSVHSALLVYIELLNKPAAKKRYDLKIPDGIDKTGMLLALRDYDMKTLYSTRGDGRLLYRLVRGLYLSVARSGRHLAKAAIHLMRKRR